MSMPQLFGGRFEVVTEITKRQNCTVFRGKDRELGGRDIAIKVFSEKAKDEAAILARFAGEVTLLKNASHHALVPIIGHGVEQGYFFIAMEHVDGATLSETLREQQKLAVDQALDIFKEVADALGELHDAGTYHGHLDSRSILFKGRSSRVAGYVPASIDGLLKEAGGSDRMTIDPTTIAPEQVTGNAPVDKRADIYAAAALLYQMLTGAKPFSGDTPLQEAMARLSSPVPSPAKLNSSVSPLIDAAIMKGLAREPKDRFQTLAEMVDAVTGGKAPAKNPFAGMSQEDVAGRLGTETMSVAMTPDMLKRILGVPDSEQSTTPPPPAHERVVNASPAHTNGADMQATAVGMRTDSVLKGSLVAISGSKRGERFLLEKDSTLVGSDALCDIRLNDGDVPPRYAMIVRRGTEYVIDSASKKNLIINGSEITEEGERPLQRGDTLKAGDVALRFVAPGEVFTLQEDVADRVIDRPKSKIGMVLAILAVLAVVAGGYGVYSYQSALDRQKSQKERATRDKNEAREQLVKKLMSEGDEFFRTGALNEPVGANARERFTSILELNPDNSYAKRRLAEIDQRIVGLDEQKRRRAQLSERLAELENDATRYMKQGDLVFPPGRNARDTYQEILRIDPENSQARAKVDEINRLVAELGSKVKVLTARARVFVELGQFLKPEKENAFDTLQGVLKADPANQEAKEILIDMAARTILEGDRARANADAQSMRDSYLSAQAMGVDPNFLEPRMRGASIMEKSRSTVIIYDRPDERAKNTPTDDKFLDSKALESRIAALRLAGSGSGGADKVFIDLGSKR